MGPLWQRGRAVCMLCAMPSTWYSDGLKFSCTQCGDCCTGRPGFVWVTREEVEAIARFLEVSIEDLRERALRKVHGRVSLTERANGDCVFYAKGCSIYPARPIQCRTFPFWPENLRSERDWDEAASECPGMGRGRLYSVEEIARLRKGEGDASSA